ALPPFVVVGIFQFTDIWNDLLFGVTILPNPNAQPVTVALNNLSGSFSADWNVVMAGAVIVALPTALIYILLGRFFVRRFTGRIGKGINLLPEFSSRYETLHRTLWSVVRRQRAVTHCIQQFLPGTRGEPEEACLV
ncbi:MAG: carbohydrate ABC transporter permease, partial [Verrucomicrobia bacterium]|nr:carbohydrate ABC transporter permease [Verrucomicrobiota bacterium]